MVTDRDHSEGTVYHACSYGGIDWTLDSCLHEDTGGVVENLVRGVNRLRLRQHYTALIYFFKDDLFGDVVEGVMISQDTEYVSLDSPH